MAASHSESENEHDLFASTTMPDVVVLKPHHLGRNYRDVITDKLSKKLGGKCVKHGYVKPGSVKLVSVADGKLVTNTLNGDVEFPVTLTAEVCNPPIGAVVPAKVVNSNKFGLLAHAGHVNQATQSWDVILEIVVTRQSIGFKSLVDPDTVSVNDRVLVEIVGKKFELNDTKISIIGKIVRVLNGPAAAAAAAPGLLAAQGAAGDVVDDDDDEITSDKDDDEVSEDNLDAVAEVEEEEEEEDSGGEPSEPDGNSDSLGDGAESDDAADEDDKSSIELEDDSDSMAGGADGEDEEVVSDDGSVGGGGAGGRDYLD